MHFPDASTRISQKNASIFLMNTCKIKHFSFIIFWLVVKRTSISIVRMKIDKILKFKYFKYLLKIKCSQHVNNNENYVASQLYEDTHHIYLKLKGLFLCKTCNLSIKIT